jgi:hypothetical protein
MVERRASVVAGLTVAVMGAVPLVWLATAPGHGTEAAAPPTVATTSAPTGEVPPAGIETDTPHIAGVSSAVTRILLAGGFASAEGVDEIPPSVAAVLAERGITLTVREGSG